MGESPDDGASIAALEEGALARVEGTIRAASRPLVSPLGAQECVYWDVRLGLDGEPERRDAQDFWLEDGTGRLLVRGADLHVEARAERRAEVVRIAEGEMTQVSARLKELKDVLRTTQGPASREIVAERRRLAKVATLLCAVRAQARGRVHLGKTLDGQAEWIAKNATLAGDGPGVRTVERMVQRWEVALAPGQRVVVSGRCRAVPLPPGVESGGYRDRALCLALVADGTDLLFAEGVGAAAPIPTEEVAGPGVAAAASAQRQPSPSGSGTRTDRVITTVTAVAVGIALAVAWFFTH